jgi:hypothetical protein
VHKEGGIEEGEERERQRSRGRALKKVKDPVSSRIQNRTS